MARNDVSMVRYKLILALADSKMRIAEAARKLGMHHTTALYHIRFIKTVTGKDPTDFYDLGDLVKMAREALCNG